MRRRRRARGKRSTRGGTRKVCWEYVEQMLRRYRAGPTPSSKPSWWSSMSEGEQADWYVEQNWKECGP
jgi:hypothetical protein